MNIYEPPKSKLSVVGRSRKGLMLAFLKVIFGMSLIPIFIGSVVVLQASSLYAEIGSEFYTYGYLHSGARFVFIMSMLVAYRFLRVGLISALVSCCLIASVESYFSMNLSKLATAWWYFPALVFVFYMLNKFQKNNA